MEAFAASSGSSAWLFLGFGSALLLGFYDIAKKRSLDGNAVTAVLLLCNIFTFLSVLLMWRVAFPSETLPDLGLRDHAMLAGKACIVTASWLCTFRAIKRLPISISAPVRASAPIFTLAGAILLLGERPDALQWLGVAFALLGYWSFSIAGRREGIDFLRNRWVLWIPCVWTCFAELGSHGVEQAFQLAVDGDAPLPDVLRHRGKSGSVAVFSVIRVKSVVEEENL